uniref:Dhx n=1 Tax=Mycobacterium leprae TaxID=1769 RepID=Q50161_MYCLR|nr:dhx [Mycobacterium leprae]
MEAYAASKVGIQAFTHSLALEYSREGLRAVCVGPGYLPKDAAWSLFLRLMPIPSTALQSSSIGMANPAAVVGVDRHAGVLGRPRRHVHHRH